MPLFLAYFFAAIGAGCLFSMDGFLWPVPALLVALAAYFTRSVRAASWTIAAFSTLLALWSARVAYRALHPEGDRILFVELMPLMQLFAFAAVLLPLLLSICGHHHLTRRDNALQRTEAGRRASSEFRP